MNHNAQNRIEVHMVVLNDWNKGHFGHIQPQNNLLKTLDSLEVQVCSGNLSHGY